MTEIELVIKIPEEEYQIIKNFTGPMTWTEHLIKKGTLLPKGHWINKHRFFDPDSCSAECSSCHKRSNGYMYDNGLTLVSTYYDFCPKCGSDNREVVEE